MKDKDFGAMHADGIILMSPKIATTLQDCRESIVTLGLSSIDLWKLVGKEL